MSFKITELTDTHMCRKQVYLPRGTHLYPSEASVKWVDEHGVERIAGACMRACWYRLKGGFSREGTTPYSEWIFALGKAVEEILVEQWKEMGIWVANNVKFYDVERNISGEVDCIIRDPETGELVGVEVKSIYGYNAVKEVCGNHHQKGQPKTSQLLQTLIYVDLGRKLGLWKYCKMVYYARDSAARTEFDVQLVEQKGALRPCINGVIDWRFTMDDIYKRYSELTEALKSDLPPVRDYEAEWTTEVVERERSLGNVSDTAYNNWKKSPKKNKIGSWQCNYCSFAKICSEDK